MACTVPRGSAVGLWSEKRVGRFCLANTSVHVRTPGGCGPLHTWAAWYGPPLPGCLPGLQVTDRARPHGTRGTREDEVLRGAASGGRVVTHAVRACSRVAEVPLESQVQRDHCTPQCQRRWSPSPARSAGREHVTCGALAPASAGLGPVAQGAHEAAGALPLRRHARGHRHTHSPSPTQKPLHLHR